MRSVAKTGDCVKGLACKIQVVEPPFDEHPGVFVAVGANE